MLSPLSRKVINTIFSGVSVPAIIILFITISIPTSNIYVNLFISYYRSLMSLITSSVPLIGYITSPKVIELLYTSIP